MPEYGWYRPCLVQNEIAETGKFNVEGVEINSFLQLHGKFKTLGFRIGNFAYSTDLNGLPEESLESLKGLEVWVVDALRYEKHPTHAHLDITLGWIRKLKLKMAILTHMGHEFEYEKLKSELPEGVIPAFDGLTTNI